jgi:hypothetical protein
VRAAHRTLARSDVEFGRSISLHDNLLALAHDNGIVSYRDLRDVTHEVASVRVAKTVRLEIGVAFVP